MDIGGYEIAIGALAALSLYIAGPLIKRIARHPAKSKLSDYYQAAPVALTSLFAEGNFVVDILQKMVREADQTKRLYWANRCYIVFALMPLSAAALYVLVKIQRNIDPTGEARGWKQWIFLLTSNLLASALLFTLLVFIKGS